MEKTYNKKPIKLYGEFGLASTWLDFNVLQNCACNCAYCFTHLSRCHHERRWKKRHGRGYSKRSKSTIDIINKRIAKAFGAKYDPENIMEYLLHERYPVMFSNNSDPFDPRCPESLGAIESLLRQGIPVQIQTKGAALCGVNGDQILDRLARHKELITMYVTITSDDSSVSKVFEPGAPSVENRVDLLRRSEDRGIATMIGLVPFVPQWFTDFDAFLGRVLETGCRKVWLEPLHLIRGNKSELKFRGDPASLELLKLEDANHDASAEEVTKSIRSKGMFCYASNWYRHAKPFEVDFSNGHKWGLMKIWQDITQAYERYQKPIGIYFDEVLRVMMDRGCPAHEFRTTGFEGMIRLKMGNIPTSPKACLGEKTTVAKMLKLFWNNPQHGGHWPFNFSDYCYLATEGKDVDGVDENGNLVYVYDPTAGALPDYRYDVTKVEGVKYPMQGR